MEIDLTPAFFLTVGGIALTVALLTELYKLWTKQLADRWWRDASIISVAILLSLIVSALAYYANRMLIDGSVLALIVLQSIVLGFMATGGYEHITKIYQFVTTAAQLVKISRETPQQWPAEPKDKQK